MRKDRLMSHPSNEETKEQDEIMNEEKLIGSQESVEFILHEPSTKLRRKKSVAEDGTPEKDAWKQSKPKLEASGMVSQQFRKNDKYTA